MDYLSTQAFLSQLDTKKKYCFILGAGASISSGIPSGYSFVMSWLNDIKSSIGDTGDYSAEIDRRINILAKGDKEIEQKYERFRNPDYCPDLSSSLDDYNRICELRFLDDSNDENNAFYQAMDGKLPYIGYYSLSNILTSTQNNIVITTNFDELIEKAIRDYTDVEPFPIYHSALASQAIEPVTNRPKILKIHQDIKIGGFNRQKYTSRLRTGWKKPLEQIFEEYTPIVIGYAGTDNSLMHFLRNNSAKGIYWCHMFGSLPNPKVKKMVQQKEGNFVEILDFDHIICHLASLFCNDSSYKNQIIGDIDKPWFSGYCAYKSRQAKKAIKRKKMGKELTSMYNNALKKKVTPISTTSLLICLRGDICNSRKKHDKAQKHYQHAYDSELKRTGQYYGKAKYNMAVTLQKAGKLIESEKVYKDFLNNEYKDPGITYLQCNAENNYALVLLQNGKAEDAKKQITKLLNHRRCDGDAYKILAAIEDELNNKAEAIQAIDSAIECYQQDNKAKLLDLSYKIKNQLLSST